MKTKSMIRVQTSDMMIGRAEGEMTCLRGNWPTAHASAVNYQAGHGIPPFDRQIITSEVSDQIILYRWLGDNANENLQDND